MNSRIKALLSGVLVCSLIGIAIVPAQARIGDKLEDMKKTDFFTFFNLGQTMVTRNGTLSFITFQPTGPAFHDLVKVTVSTDGSDTIIAMGIDISRSFVDDKQKGIFARDIAKSFLRSVIAEADENSINDLANEIEFAPSDGDRIEGTSSKPKLPEKPTDGYQVYLGTRDMFGQSFTKTGLKIENINSDHGKILRLSISAK